MKKLALICLLSLIGSIFLLGMQANGALAQDKYAVGGELIPISTASYLLSPWVLALLMLIIAVIGGAITTGKINIELI
jgi:hypothetical protein